MTFFRTFTHTIILTLTLISCEEENEITTVDFTQTISTILNVDLPEDSAGAPVTFTETETIDFSTVQQIQDNIDDIQNAEIDALSFEVNNYSGPANMMATNASLNFDNTTIQLQDIDLQQADNNNTVFPIDDPAVLAAIENALQSSNTVTTVNLTATLGSTPVYFEVIFYLDVTVTASGD
jgi:hypothetical protein